MKRNALEFKNRGTEQEIPHEEYQAEIEWMDDLPRIVRIDRTASLPEEPK
jgi:hypothetical protein